MQKLQDRLGMRQTFTVPGRFPGFNDWQRLSKNTRARAALKKKCDQHVAECARFFGVEPMEGPIRYRCTWYEANLRRDLDNIAFAKKFIQDGLVKAGVLPDDSLKYIAGFSDDFALDRENPRVEITLEDING